MLNDAEMDDLRWKSELIGGSRSLRGASSTSVPVSEASDTLARPIGILTRALRNVFGARVPMKMVVQDRATWQRARSIDLQHARELISAIRSLRRKTDTMEQTDQAWRERFGSFVDSPPAGWRARLDVRVGANALPMFTHANGCAVALSIDPAPTGWYLHLSVSRADRLPRWPEIVSARDSFLGRETPCVHAIPDVREHRDLHPYCLHVWARADGDPILDPALAMWVAP